jgi:uncharacterized protein (TIGR02996 family)
MSDILDALQIEVRLHPEDEVPRLVLADWLEENGDETDRARVEFIRIQCQLARRRDRDLEWRERSLWWQHVETWLGPIYDASTNFRFHRGLVAIEMDGDRLSDDEVDELFAHPAWLWVERLDVRKPRPGVLMSLLRAPAVTRLRCLSIEGGEDLWEEFLDFSDCRPLHLLQELAIRRTALEERGIVMLSGCRSLTGLTALDLSHNLLHGPVLERIGKEPELPALRSLELAHNPLGYDQREVAMNALRSFLNSPMASRLTRLGLAGTALGGDGVAILAASPALRGLTDLDLSSNGIDDAAMEVLADSPMLGNLKRLLLGDNDFDGAGLVALTRSPHLEQLEWLELRGNALTAGALRVLIEAPSWPNLRKLRLGRQQASSRVVNELHARFGNALAWW